MGKKKTNRVLANIMVAICTALAWFAGFVVMQIVYDSIVASIVFGSVVAVIVFCESRFSYITLKSDGKISISKEEVKSNLWQIVAATAVGLVVSVPLLLKVFEQKILMLSSNAAHELGLQLKALEQLFSSNGMEFVFFCLAVVVIYNSPLMIKMMKED